MRSYNHANRNQQNQKKKTTLPFPMKRMKERRRDYAHLAGKKCEGGRGVWFGLQELRVD